VEDGEASSTGCGGDRPSRPIGPTPRVENPRSGFPPYAVSARRLGRGAQRRSPTGCALPVGLRCAQRQPTREPTKSGPGKPCIANGDTAR